MSCYVTFTIKAIITPITSGTRKTQEDSLLDNDLVGYEGVHPDCDGGGGNQDGTTRVTTLDIYHVAVVG